ncbi:MAG: choice-of-anchor I family protein [Bacteroidetes bacterium]|nr:choice-of-anchor I family protein [Fibrella sp.]
MKKLFLSLLLLLPLLSFGQLAPGSIAFTGTNGDGNDNLSFVVLDAIPANTTVFFRDDEWQNPGFNTGESIITWTSGGAVTPAGTVVAFSNVNPDPATPIVVSSGSATITGNRGIAAGGDAFFAYVGTDENTPTTFLAAISSNGPAEFGTLAGTPLTVGATALSLTGGIAIGAYNGPRTGISRVCYPSVINNAVNWQTQANAGGDQSADGTLPDVPFSTTALTFGSMCPLPTVAFSAASQSVSEAAGTVSLTLAVTSPGSTTGSVQLTIGSGSAQNGADFTLAGAPVTITVPANATSVVYSFPVINDTDPEADEYLTLRLQNAVGIQIGAVNSQLILLLDNDKLAPVGDASLALQLLTTYRNPSAGSSEIVAYDKVSKRLFIANSVANRIDIVNFANPSAPVATSSISVSALGGSINSVAVNNGILAVAIENADKVLNGKIVFLDANGTKLSEVTAGALPDMIAFSPDGRYVLTANEGEPNDDYSVDPEGSITIVDLIGGAAALTQSAVTTAGFTSFNGQKEALRTAGVRLYGRKGNVNNGSSVAEDLEPEYITFSADGQTAYVTLQENNALAVLNVATKTVSSIKPLGLKNHNLDVNALDLTDQGGILALQKLPVFGMYQPDAIASFSSGGQTFLVTANEGDAREYAALTEDVRVGASTYVLDPTVFPNAADLKNNLLVGRLNVTTQTGDTDGDGDFDQIHAHGARSFSIFDAAGTLVWDSGDQLERITRTQTPALFNSSNTAGNPAVKNRSDDKGPEPEGVTTAVINGKTYAFVTLERIGGVMVYDVTTPTAPKFVTYTVNRTAPTATAATDDRGPEGILYIAPADSPNGQGLLLLANEVSNSVSVYQVTAAATGLALTQPTYDCATGGIVFNTTGGDGTPITYFAPGIIRSSVTSNVGTVESELRADPKPLLIRATQSGQTVEIPFDFAAFCANATPGGSFTLTQPTYNCATGAIIFNTTGGDGTPITYFAPGIIRSALTSNMGIVEAELRDDPKPLLIRATQSGQTVQILFDFGTFCSQQPGGVFALTQPTYNCATGGITFNTIGGDGTPITYFAPGIIRSALTSNVGTVEAELRADPKPLLIRASQSGRNVQIMFDFAAFCSRSAREGVSDVDTDLRVTIIGNPVPSETVAVDVRGAEGQPLRLTLLDVQGRTVSNQSVKQAGVVERQTVAVGRTPGIYFLQVSTSTRSRTVKVMRQ